MTRKFPLALALLTIAACAGGSTAAWLKPGVASDVAFRQEAACRTDARQVAPVDRRISTAPSITLGVGANRCSGGVCVGVGTVRDVFDSDRNEPRRDQAFGACMGRAGYALTALPRCTGTVTTLATHPFDTRGVCVTADGRLAGL